MRRTLLSIGVAGAWVIACGETRLDAGSSDRDPNDAGVFSVIYQGTPSNSLNLPCDLPAPDFVAGIWTGTFDTLTLPSGSSTIVIDVKGSYRTSDGLCGTVVFGTGDPLPLPTDASSYPPGTPTGVAWSTMQDGAREGFPYDFDELGNEGLGVDGGYPLPIGVQGNRIQFSINLRQIYNAWCNMQRAYYYPMLTEALGTLSGMGWSCLPPLPPPQGPSRPCGNGAIAGITVHGVSCEQAEVCATHYCSCTGTPKGETPSSLVTPGCSASDFGVPFDFHVTGGDMVGAINLPSGIELAHLTRKPARDE